MNQHVKSGASYSNPDGAARPMAEPHEHGKKVGGHAASASQEPPTSPMDSQKAKAVQAIGNLAEVLREAADKLKDSGPVPNLAGKTADGMERVADYVHARTVGDLVGEVKRFARREPALFVGGALALGLVAGRFLKSASHGSRRTDDDVRDA